MSATDAPEGFETVWRESLRVDRTREQELSLRALRAFGEAVVTVAQARLVVRLMERGEVVSADRSRQRSWPYYLLRAEGMTQRALVLYRIDGYGPTILAEWLGALDDMAPLGVARMIEEASR